MVILGDRTACDTTYDDICRALVVKGDGSFDDTGYSICSEDGFGVRPGFHLNESKVMFLSSAIDGKDSGDEGADALIAVKDNFYGIWKLTLKDDAREGFDAKVSDTEPEAHSWVEVDYSGAVTGDDEYLSALIMDKDGDVTYYGRIKALANEADKSGSVKINLEGKRNDGDSLYVFNEHCSGDYKTDWSSELKKMTIEVGPINTRPASATIKASRKTTKITFTKKAPKGKYTFKITSPAKGNFKKATKHITINVK